MTPDVMDPLSFCNLFWPTVTLYKEQKEILYSLRDNDETFVPAGNMLGKDFVAALGIIWFFLSRHPCRVVTTSAKDEHLRVLWSEVNRFVQTAAYPLDSKQGGPLVVNHQNLGKLVQGKLCPVSYVTGLVASQNSMAAMQGHHVAKTGDGVPRTLFVVDEASSVPDDYYKMASTWFNRSLVIGNTWPCENFWKRAIEGDPDGSTPGGDLPSPDGKRLYRKVIHVTAEQSPNVRFALAQIAAGKEPTGEMLVPGVKDYATYAKDRATKNEEEQSVSLDAKFYKGKGVMMFPREWLEHSRDLARRLSGDRRALAVGVDPGEGSADTSMAAGDRQGLIDLASRKTPDTNVIPAEAEAFWKFHGVEASRVVFDAGGGGTQAAHRLRASGHNVRTVAFGGPVVAPPRRGMATIQDRIEQQEDRYECVNRRAELYWQARQMINPNGPNGGYAIPERFVELFRQLSLIPLRYDNEGRIYLPSKNKKDSRSKTPTLTEIVGRSPDEADAFCLMVDGLLHSPRRAVAGAM